MRTTVRLDDTLLRQAKRLAAETGQSLTAVIEDALREVVGRRAASSASKKKSPFQPSKDGDCGLESIWTMQRPYWTSWKNAGDSCRCECPGVRVSSRRVRTCTLAELVGTAGRLARRRLESQILFSPVFYKSSRIRVSLTRPVRWKTRCVLWKGSNGCATMLRFVLARGTGIFL